VRPAQIPRILGWSSRDSTIKVCAMPARSPEEIHALIAAAFNADDLDAFIELHEQDATTIIPPDGRAVSGHDARSWRIVLDNPMSPR
jgi:hypothetical protein